MKPPRIFIASSEKSQGLAKSLAARLRKEMKGQIDAHVWIECLDVGVNTLASLIEQCRQSDFAAVFLTKDDLVQRPSDTSPHLAPSDNCIFEAGMFTGVFGGVGKRRAGTKRCFVLSSMPFAHLPSDLRGINTLEIEEQPDSPSIRKAARKIKETVLRYGRARKPELPLYTEEELLDREQAGEGGDLDDGSEVLINLSRPIEVGSVFAGRVLRNLRAGVKYKYFFSVENLGLIARLLHSIATAGHGPGEDDRIEVSEKNLERMQRQLSIRLVAARRPFQFCIHNAHRTAKVACYLRRPGDGRFVQWCVQDEAMEIVNYIHNSLIPPLDGEQIFRSSKDFDLYAPKNSARRSALEKAVKELFDKALHERVMDLCFGERASVGRLLVIP